MKYCVNSMYICFMIYMFKGQAQVGCLHGTAPALPAIDLKFESWQYNYFSENKNVNLELTSDPFCTYNHPTS